MKRRNFLASLLALPFAAKPLEALASKPMSLWANQKTGELVALFDRHKQIMESNTESLQQLTRALLLNTPSGFKEAAGRYGAEDVSAMRRAAQRYKKRLENE